MEIKVRNEKWNGMHVHIVPTKQFKSILISFKMTNQLTKEEAIKRYMITLLMGTSSLHFKDNYEFVRAFDRLYGASFSTSIGCSGAASYINNYFEFIDPAYIENKDYIENITDLIEEILLHPAIIEGRYEQSAFEQCLSEIEYRFQDLLEDKEEHASQRMVELMGENTTFGIPNIGYASQIDSLDPYDLAEYYNQCLKEDRKDLYLVGDISDELLLALKKKLIFEDYNNEFQAAILFESHKTEVLKVEETDEISQSKLLMGFTLEGNYLSEKNNQYVLMNAVLGGNSNSLLFDLVREKYGLCYSINSLYDESYGILMVVAGVKSGNEQKCIDLILECISKLKEGKFEESLLKSNQERILSAIVGSQDSRYGIIRSLFNQHLNHKHGDISSYDHIAAMTKEEIIQVSQELKLDTIYILKGDRDE